ERDWASATPGAPALNGTGGGGRALNWATAGADHAAAIPAIRIRDSRRNRAVLVGPGIGPPWSGTIRICLAILVIVNRPRRLNKKGGNASSRVGKRGTGGGDR